MINHSVLGTANVNVNAYTVTVDSLHIFIADTIKRLGGIRYQSDILLDYDRMLHNMNEGGG